MSGASRRACTIAPDGSIAQAEVTSCGLNGGPLKGTGRYEARIACQLGFREPSYAYCAVHEADTRHPYFTQSGADREDNPNQYIANMTQGAWCGFKYFAFDGERNITVTTRGTGDGSLLVSTSRDAAPFTSIPITPSDTWAAHTAAFAPLTGTHALYFRFEGTGAVDFMDFTVE